RLAKLPSATPVPPRTQPLGEPPFRIPIELPPGLAEKIFAKTRCSDSWLGVASVTVDRVGRVQDVATKRVYTSPRCAEVLETLLRLSFADPTRIGAPMSTDQFQVVKGTGHGCFDEAPVDDVPGGELLRAGGNVVAPVVIERVEPQYPRGSFQRRSSGMVMAEAIITRTGCVRDVRVVAQSHAGELNSAAVLALSKWKFKPGTLDGQPVDVLFHLTINFKQ
ncbi:MAG TPA: energy transducer TonB, partial [Thermoanaerobaculia bacterium]|nr:energy transducer TonB [Thermoanaerobaculia bacterium]